MTIRRIRKGSTTYYLLLALEKAIEAEIAFSDFVYNPGKFAFTGYRENPNSSALYQSVKQLREKGYIETRKDGRKLLIKLTDAGKQKIILAKLLENKAWDNKWRIVIFDIPEKHRKLRQILRAKLREWQFEPLQRSVWVSKKDIVKELKVFLKEVGIDDWVKIFEATTV